MRSHPRLRTRRLALALALCLSSGAALPLGLGEAQVSSFIGSPLKVEIPLRIGRDESVDEGCISLQPLSLASDGISALALRMRIIRGDRDRLLIESQRVTTEPYATLRVRVECGGASLVREYAVLLDPPPTGERGSAPGGLIMSPLVSDASAEAEAGDLGLAGDGSTAATPSRPARAARGKGARARRERAALRLDNGFMSRRTEAAAQRTGAGSGQPVLRLDVHFDGPGADTPALVTQRTQLRDLRAMMLSGDDTLERLLALQGQLGALETQLRALQSGGSAAAPGNPAMIDPARSGMVPPVASAATPASAPAAAPKVNVVVHRPPPPPPDDGFGWLLPTAGLSALLLCGAGGLLWWRRRPGRGRAEEVAIPADESALLPTEAPAALVAAARRDSGDAAEGALAGLGPDSVPTEKAARNAYLAARFPEIATGLIRLADADSVLNGARLYIETGDADRAEELLEASIQEGGGRDIRPWLGLFEVHRMQGKVEAFGGLLGPFRERFADSRYLPEVLAAGRQIAPDDPRFQAPEGMRSVEIGPDGTTWLNPELDFVPQALARDLHETLMMDVEDDAFTLSPAGAARS